ncbi:hypothetical protein [Deinococcus peraridilitoris]|uniref:Uncharacterized protein n=1 Tax=Deinococcus peraridilitoris (strain DSM 19664 / LMG 22246 / CIP 109416 / KR-200) TaxID=937777 RepID=L0A9G8_DEIPD|nr:hypothetical protein [Deinococcus peraridilitoris]AFZ69690.1 hypothetical protein Deipe_4350 [Deinococcus peraridilitoris DSM 19664]
MGKATTFLYQQESGEDRQRENEARDGKMAYGVAAEKAAERAGQELTDEQRKRYGSDLHWAFSLDLDLAYAPRSTACGIPYRLLRRARRGKKGSEA